MMAKGLVVVTMVIVVASATDAELEDNVFLQDGGASMDGSNLLGVSSFAMLDAKAHLAYLSAKSYASKNAPQHRVKKASETCDQARKSAFMSCGKKFCECQGDAPHCSTLDLSVFLETPNFALKAAKDECTTQKIHAGCRQAVTKAYGQCQDAFLQIKPPSHDTLLEIRNVKDFVHLAGQFSRDGHTHVFDMDFLQSAMAPSMEFPEAAVATGSADMGPKPNSEEAYRHKLAMQNDQWERMEADERRVERDEAEVQDMHVTPPAKEAQMEKLKLAVAKCSKLKEMTFSHCGELMCEYHTACGTQSDIDQCKKHASEMKNLAKHKEAKFKIERRLQNMKEADDKEHAVKAPELKKKAEDKEAAWKAGAPERASKSEEFKEIDEKSKKMVGGWTKNVVSDPWNDHHGRRLLEADKKDLDAEEEMKKVADEDAKEKGHKKDVDDKLHSAKCVAKSASAFNMCEALTAKSYDDCESLLTAADADFVEGMKRDAEAEDTKAAVKAEPAKVVNQAGNAMPPQKPEAYVGGGDSGDKAPAQVIAPSQVTAPEVLPEAAKVAPVGDGEVHPEVQKDRVMAHVHTEATADDLKVEQKDEEAGNFPGSTKAAKEAEANAEAVVDQNVETSNDDLKHADVEAPKAVADADAVAADQQMYQAYSTLYDETLADTDVEENLYQQEAALFEEDVVEEN
jgi:hypothetical protein